MSGEHTHHRFEISEWRDGGPVSLVTVVCACGQERELRVTGKRAEFAAQLAAHNVEGEPVEGEAVDEAEAVDSVG